MFYFESTTKKIFLLIIFVHFGSPLYKTFTAQHPWGNWKNKISCGWNNIVCGIQNRLQESLWWWGDDTSLNGFKIFCCGYRTGIVREAKQYAGLWGYWDSPRICTGRNRKTYAVGAISLKWQSYARAGDDTAICGIRMRCRSERLPYTYYDTPSVQSNWGFWLDHQVFAKYYWMYGFKVKFQDSCGKCDDVAITGVKIYTDFGSRQQW